MPSLPETPPVLDALHRKLLPLREHLIHDGSVIRRQEKDRRPSWRLRARIPSPDGSRPKHIAIPLENEQTATYVRNLLQNWKQTVRNEKQEVKENIPCAIRQVQDMAGTSRRRRRFARQTYMKALKQGDTAVWIMEHGQTYLPPVNLVGRPRKYILQGMAGVLKPLHQSDQVELHDQRETPSAIRGTKIPVFDRGFDTKVPSYFDRPKRKPQFSRRTWTTKLDWRYKAALNSVYDSRTSPDKWCRRMVYYLAGLVGKRNNPTGYYRPIQAAHSLYKAHSPDKYRLEALLLTGESDMTIASVLHMSRHTIRAYRKIFYDIDSAPKMKLQAYYAMPGRLNQYDRWKYVAVKGGLDVLLHIWKFESQMESK